MTVDEALAIVETVLDDAEQLNDVQELIFRQCWEGRCSYEEISQLSQYNESLTNYQRFQPSYSRFLETF